MNTLLVLSALLGILPGFGHSQQSEHVNVTLIYVSYCPYCIQYVTEQLYPTFLELSEYLNVELVPTATKKLDGGQLSCMHGPKECEANKLHACAMHDACGNQTSHGTMGCDLRQTKKALHYINCLMSQPDQKAACQKCSMEAGLNHDNIEQCANGNLGDELLMQYYNRFKNYPVRVDIVPFVVVNNNLEKRAIDQATSNLKEYICSLIPQADPCIGYPEYSEYTEYPEYPEYTEYP